MARDPAARPRLAMKLFRIAAIAILFVVATLAVSAIILSYNQDRVVKLILDRARDKTGLEISSSGGTVALSTHLVVTFWSPRVSLPAGQAIQAPQAQVLISYHSLIYGSGLPLFDLVLDRPQATVSRGGMPVALPRPDESTAAAMVGATRKLAGLTRKFEIIDGSAQSTDGARLLSRVNLVAYTRRHLRPSAWQIKFTLRVDASSLYGSRWAGEFTISPNAGKDSQAPVAQGRLWTWNIPTDRLYPGETAVAGELEGQVDAALAASGHASGSISIGVRNLAIKTSKVVTLGDYTLGGSFDISPDKIQLTDFALRHEKSVMLAGQCQVADPYEANPQVSILMGGLRADLATLKEVLETGLFAPPEWLTALSSRMDSGTVRLDEVAVDAPLSDLRSVSGTGILRKFDLSASIQDLGFTPPPETKLPPVRGGSAQLSYSRGILKILQGSAQVGASTISEFRARANLSRGFDRVYYAVTVKAKAELSELFPWFARTAGSIGENPEKWVKSVRGLSGIEFTASGALDGSKWAAPEKYSGTIAPEQVEITMRERARSITIDGGVLAFTTGRFRLERVRIGLHPGRILTNGEVELADSRVGLNNLSVELERVPADGWLSLAVSPDQFAVKEDVNGKMTVNLGAADPARYSIDGALALGPGQMQFGFIRSPMLVKSATVDFKGHDAVLNLPASRLEGHRVDMKVTVTNLRKASVRIDAVAQKLDLEALKFVRLPWMPKTPPVFPSGQLAGHIEVREGNLEKLSFSNLRTDFRHNDGNWRVYNLHATSLKGAVDLRIIGRPADDWIHMKGHVAGMNTGALFRILEGGGKPLVIGKLYGDFDLWGDTDTDFFDTLAGKISLAAKDGRLEKFTLLSRLLGLIDVKNWLSAQVPDPRKTGLPFRFFTGDFAGSSGAFYTADLLLDGPVMDITGTGGVDVGEGTINMELGVLPFQTVNWIITKIPLIGKSIAASSNILAAYFRVQGPVRDPRITPEPFTSAAELVTKILSFPINLLSRTP